MGESLTQQRRVGDEGLRVVNRFQQGRIQTVPAEEAPANYVPAAAVIRRGQALSGFIGRKRLVGGHAKSDVKSQGLTLGLQWIRAGWRQAGENGIPGVAVKCADIGRNTGGEGGSLGLT